MISDGVQEWRDLMWAVNSPSLLADDICSLATGEAVDSSSIDPDEVVSFIREEPTRRVGRYFERLIHFYLSRIRQADIIASGLQIRDVSRTVGELDFVFRERPTAELDGNPKSLLTHWETAVKFYLWCPDRTVEGSHLIGPNAADTFDRKVSRLLQHQVPLGQTEEARKPLNRIAGSPERPRSLAFVKGRIFYPAEFSRSQFDLTKCAHPAELSPGHLHGVWVRESQIGLLGDRSQEWFTFVEKPYWLAPPEHYDLSASMVVDRLKTDFLRSRSPQLLACCRSPALPEEAEAQHVFVVPEEWPGLASV